MSILDRALRVGEAKQYKQYADRVDRINAFEPELELEDEDELKARFVDLGLEPFASSPTEFGTFIVEHTETWGKIIRAANIKPN